MAVGADWSSRMAKSRTHVPSSSGLSGLRLRDLELTPVRSKGGMGMEHLAYEFKTVEMMSQ